MERYIIDKNMLFLGLHRVFKKDSRELRHSRWFPITWHIKCSNNIQGQQGQSLGLLENKDILMTGQFPNNSGFYCHVFLNSHLNRKRSVGGSPATARVSWHGYYTFQPALCFDQNLIYRQPTPLDYSLMLQRASANRTVTQAKFPVDC